MRHIYSWKVTLKLVFIPDPQPSNSPLSIVNPAKHENVRYSVVIYLCNMTSLMIVWLHQISLNSTNFAWRWTVDTLSSKYSHTSGGDKFCTVNVEFILEPEHIYVCIYWSVYYHLMYCSSVTWPFYIELTETFLQDSPVLFYDSAISWIPKKFLNELKLSWTYFNMLTNPFLL